MVNLSTVWVLLALLFLMEFMYLKQSYAIGRERREYEEQMRLLGRIAYYHGFFAARRCVKTDYIRDYEQIMKDFNKVQEEKQND